MLDPIRIASLDDSRVADYRNVRDADLRGGGGFSPAGPRGSSNKLFIAESLPVIQRLIDSQRYAIKSIFLSDEKWETLKDAWSSPATSAAPVFVAGIEVLREIAGYRHHGGALAIGIRPNAARLDAAALITDTVSRAASCLLLCEGITHVDNIGAIFRIAGALGAAGIILDRACADPLFRKAIRVSMGEVFNVRWGVAEDFHAELHSLALAGTTIVAADTHESAVPVTEFAFPGRCAILLGTERHGISAKTLSAAHHVVEIPMVRPGSSLNVAVAGAIMLHEWRRQCRSRSQE